MAEGQVKLAYILGAIYGDGCFSKEGKVVFGATDLEFVKKVNLFIKDLFDLKLKIHCRGLSKQNKNWKDYYEIFSRRLFKKLDKFEPKNGMKIPEFVKVGSTKVRASFTRGFFDAEGNVDVRKVKRRDGRRDTIRHVKAYSNSRNFLEDLCNLLKQLGIKSSVLKSKGYNYCVCLWNYRSIKLFSESVGFVIKRKQKALIQALKSYKEIQTRWDYKSYQKVMSIRRSKYLGAKLIRRTLLKQKINIPQPTIEAWVYKKTKVTNTGGAS